MSKPKYETLLYCRMCEKLVGSRPTWDMELLPCTRIEIICTCSECAKPKTDIPDFLMWLFRNNG